MSPATAQPTQPDQFIITISGSRSITNQSYVWDILDERASYYLCNDVTADKELVFRLGDATGVDYLALQWARERGFRRSIYFADRKGYDTWLGMASVLDLDLESAVLAADWDGIDGKFAGPIRNSAMLGFGAYAPLANLLIAIWDGESRGCRNCMASARNGSVFIQQFGGAAKVTFKTPGERDSEIVEWHDTRTN